MNRFFGLCLIVFVLALTADDAGAALTPPSKEGITQADCDARAGHLMKVIQDWEAAGHHVVYDPQDFWKCLGPEVTLNKLARFITLEEWRNPSPVRTKKEVAMYLKIKEFIVHRRGDQTLDMAALLRMGLEACADPQGDTNLQIALLTVHNVVRILARPNQWPEDPSPADPAYPIFMELKGRASVGGPSILDALKVQRRPLDSGWSLKTLFDISNGYFQPQPGAVTTEWNGGCHYYFWIGAMSRTTMGVAAVWAGIAGETLGKKPDLESYCVIDKVIKQFLVSPTQQGVVEVSMFVCGANFGSKAFEAREGVLAKIPDKPSLCPAPPTGGVRLVLQDISVEVRDYTTNEWVKKSKMESPTSQWAVTPGNFGFASRKDGFQLSVSWEDLPLFMDPMTPYAFTIKASIKGGPRDAQVAFSPDMDIAGWRIRLLDSSDGVKKLGTNVHRLDLRGSPTAEKPKLEEGFMRLEIVAVGRGASIKGGEVVGGTGKFFTGKQPDQFDAFFLMLELNSFARVFWTYVPEGSPNLKPAAAEPAKP